MTLCKKKKKERNRYRVFEGGGEEEAVDDSLLLEIGMYRALLKEIFCPCPSEEMEVQLPKEVSQQLCT